MVMSLDARRRAHGRASACVDGAIGARSTRSAARSRNDVLAARSGARNDRGVSPSEQHDEGE